MDATQSSQTTDSTPPSVGTCFAAKLLTTISYFHMRRTSLSKQAKRFGTWLESDAQFVDRLPKEGSILIKLKPDGLAETAAIVTLDTSNPLDNYPQLWIFLYSLGIHNLELDVRLEQNQIMDVITLLYAYRRKLRDSNARGRIVGALLSDSGLHVACTSTAIKDNTLTIAYSYCTLAFTRLVRWFEKKQRNFHDHRALFHAAPQYAAIVAAIAIIPGLAYAYLAAAWTPLILSALAAVPVFAVVYAFIMLAGSVEYDNEEKDYQLNKAYQKVKRYTEQIKADLNRARTIQSKFLPDSSDTQLSEIIDWDASFVPAAEVGGDYYDVQALDKNRIAILFADVSGHGMAAAFVTGILKTTFAAWTHANTTLPEFTARLNSTLHRLIPSGNFAAVFLAIYDCTTADLSYLNAGHHPEPWRIPADEDRIISPLNDARTLIMGVNDEIAVESSKLKMSTGDIIVFVSDGIIENQNTQGDFYGIETLEDLLKTNRGKSTGELVREIVEQTDNFSKDAPQTDDRTVLAFQIKA